MTDIKMNYCWDEHRGVKHGSQLGHTCFFMSEKESPVSEFNMYISNEKAKNKNKLVKSQIGKNAATVWRKYETYIIHWPISEEECIHSNPDV